MYLVRISKSAKKDLLNVDSRYRSRLKLAITFISQNSYIGKKLKDPSGIRYSYRVGIYRIIYEIYKKEIAVFIIRIGHRQGVYR